MLAIVLTLAVAVGPNDLSLGADEPTIVAEIPLGLGSLPADLEVNTDTNRVYAVDLGLEADWVIDAGTNSVLGELDFEGAWVRGRLAANPVTNRVYVATEIAVFVFDGSTNQKIGTIPLPTTHGGFIPSIAVNAVTNSIYVGQQDLSCQFCTGFLTVIDGATSSVVPPSIVLSGGNPMIAVNEVTNMVYLATSRDTVDVLDGVTNTIGATVTVGVGAGEHHIAVDAERNRIHVENRASHNISVIDGSSNAEIGTLAAPQLADTLLLAMNSTNNHLYVAAALSGGSHLYVLDADTGETIATFAIPLPTDLAAQASMNRLYVASVNGSVLVVQDGLPPVTDGDNDGVMDLEDSCLATPAGEPVDLQGCSQSQVDSDADGICNTGAPSAGPAACAASDTCPETATGDTVDANGCSQAQVDQDLDRVCDLEVTTDFCTGSDACPSTPPGAAVDARGCSQLQADQDLDSVCDIVGAGDRWCIGFDSCPNTLLSERPVDSNGCSREQVDQNGDGLCDDRGVSSRFCTTVVELSLVQPPLLKPDNLDNKAQLWSGFLNVMKNELFALAAGEGKYPGDECYFGAVDAASRLAARKFLDLAGKQLVIGIAI